MFPSGWSVRWTRKQFLLNFAALAGWATAPRRADAAHASGKVLLVVAHPDDEYTFAGTVYRLARELGWAVDQVVITNGEAGYKYSSLAERVYGVALTDEEVGRRSLPTIRKNETLAAGKILGIREHFFLDEKDARFTLDAGEALQRLWKPERICQFLTELMRRERYDFVLTMLPTAETHGHHQAATLLALEAANRLPADQRPAILGSEPAKAEAASPVFTGRDAFPLMKTWPGAPQFVFDRRQPFGYHDALNYQIVVNWMIAEHKSQGLFQTDCNRHDVERYWLFAESGPTSLAATERLFAALRQPLPHEPAEHPAVAVSQR